MISWSRRRMKMRMRLAFLLLLAVALALYPSHMGNDPAENSCQNSSEDSHQNFPRDVGASPRISPQGSRRGSGTPRLLPAPVLLRLPPEHKPSRIRCLAPQGFSIGSFELLQEISGIFVQNTVVVTNQDWADFPLPRAAVWYQSHNGSTWLESELSPAIGSSDLGDAECQPSDSTATARTSQNGTTTLPRGCSLAQSQCQIPVLDPGTGSRYQILVPDPSDPLCLSLPHPSWLLPVLVVGLLLLGAVVIIW